MEYVIGVDAGGTSTTASAYEWETAGLLGQGKSGYGNALVDYAAAMGHLREAIGTAIAGLQGSCRLILVGAAGATAGGLKERMAAELGKEFRCKTAVETDARLALEGSLQGGDGILLVSGTGSIAIGRKGNFLQTAGGWGNLIGDEGSGYDLVRRTIRLMTEDEDHGRPEKPVCRKVREFFGVMDTRQVIGYLHNHVKAEIAQASPVVEQAAEAGDPDAKRFLIEAGDALAGLVICLANRLELPAGFPLALHGSVIRNVTPIRNRMLEALDETGIACSLVSREGDLTCGAWYYAKVLERNRSTNYPAEIR